MKKNIILMTSLIVSLSSSTYAATITNNLMGMYEPAQAPSAMQPSLCFQDGAIPIHVGETFDSNAFVSGAGVRFVPAGQSCNQSQSYFGWINASGGVVQYTTDASLHIQLVNLAINSQLTGKLSFSPIGPTERSFPFNPDSTAPQNVNWFAGFNLSGLEFSTMPNSYTIPSLSASDYAINPDHSDLKDTERFLNQGANIIRLPIRWAYVQPGLSLNSGVPDPGLDLTYFNSLVAPTLKSITNNHYYAILDLHSYMHYSTIGDHIAGCFDGFKCPDGTLVTDPQKYVNVWSDLWAAIKDKNSGINTDYLMIDIVNEPAVADSEKGQLDAQKVFDMEVAVIKALQSNGFTGYFLVEGYGWSGLHSWKQNGNDTVFTRANFQQAGVKDLSKIIINVHQYLDSDYSGTHDVCQQDLSTTGVNGFNLNDFVTYLQNNQFKAIVTETGVGANQGSCERPLKGFLDYLKQNAYTETKNYGFVGWTIWSTGHGWGNYNLRVTPNDWKNNAIAPYFKLQS